MATTLELKINWKNNKTETEKLMSVINRRNGQRVHEVIPAGEVPTVYGEKIRGAGEFFSEPEVENKRSNGW